MPTPTIIEAIALIDENHRVSVTELIQVSGLSEEEINALCDFGLLEPVGSSLADSTFPPMAISLVRTASRLRRHFELNTTGLGLALMYLQRIRELEARLGALECERLDASRTL